MKNKRTAVMGLMSAAALALGVHQAGAVTTNVVYNGIGGDTTWSPASGEYLLMEPVFVTNGAILTIQAGTVIRGKWASNASLVIARGAKIRAMGTAANPIVFTCEGDNNIAGMTATAPWNDKTNEIDKKWGGLILLGRTYVATDVGGAGQPSPNSGLTMQVEGITEYGDFSKYGGGNDDDNSGELHYVSLRYGGFILGGNNEINGLTLGAVGRGTQIDHIEIFHNADDDIEFFGGTVNTKYIVAWSSADDGMDTDEGYRGKQQFLLRVKGAFGPTQERSDKSTEEDGAYRQKVAGVNAEAQPSSCPMWYNWTQIGLGKDSSPINHRDTGIMMRDCTGGRFYNGLWMDFGGAPAMIEGAANTSDGVYEAADNFLRPYPPIADPLGLYTHEAVSLDGVRAKFAEMKYNAFWKFGTNGVPAFPPDPANPSAEWGTDSNHDGHQAKTLSWYGYPLFSDGSLHNFYLPEGDGTGGTFLSPVTQLARRSTGTTLTNDLNFGVSRTYYNVDTLNPLPRPGYDGALMTFGRVPPNDNFFTPVNFIGAFGKTKNWALGWTLASRLGLIAGGVQGDYTGIVPGIQLNGSNIEVKLDADVYQGMPADLYVVFETTPGTFFVYAGGAVVPGVGTPTAPNFTLPGTPGIPWTAVPGLTTAMAPPGTTRAYFCVDVLPNGVPDLMQLYIATIP